MSDYRLRTLLEEGNRAYATLRLDPQVWAEELEERMAWENTLADGLEEDESSYPKPVEEQPDENG